MNAFASSSGLGLSATRRIGSLSPLVLRQPLLSSRLPSSLVYASRTFHTTPSPSIPLLPSILRTIPSSPSQPIGRLLKDLHPFLPGSPTTYLLRRNQTTASPSPSSKSRPANEEDPENDPEPDPNLSAYARLKILFKRYGWYALGMYTILSALDFTLCFLLIHLAGAERITPLLDYAAGKYRVIRYGSEKAEELAQIYAKEAEEEKREIEREGKKKEKGWISRTVVAELALAYPVHKVALLPVRAGLTVAWTPKFVGWLTRRGWVGKGGYTRAASHAQDKLRVAKDRVKEKVQDLKQ